MDRTKFNLYRDDPACIGPIFEDYFKSRPHTWIFDENDSAILSQCHNTKVVTYVSNLEYIQGFFPSFNSTITVRNFEGSPEWDFHIDDGDMNTLARFKVTTFEEANRVLLNYNMWLGAHCDLAHLPEWDMDMVMAELLEPIVRRFAKATKKTYYPPQVGSYKEWRGILGKIIFSLRMCRVDITDQYDFLITKFPEDVAFKKWTELLDRIDNGLILFGKYFREFCM